MAQKTPKISVVIPVFNTASFIEETLMSIFAQNYTNLEVFVQDGGSTDGTVSIIKNYAKKYPKILQFVSRKDKGQADAINKGLAKCSGEIITFINADDIFESGVFWTVANSYEKHPSAMWFAGQGIVIDGNGTEKAKLVTWYKNTLLKINSFNLLLSVNYLMQPSVFLTRKGYEEIKEFTSVGRIVMEYEAWLKLGSIKMPIIIDKTLSKFRMSGKNISSTLYKETLQKDQELVEKYSQNKLLILLHKINNIGRLGVVQLLH